MKKLLQIRFVKALTITIFISIQILGTAYAQEKQKACLAPMGALGDISEMQKQIIFNSLQEYLYINKSNIYFRTEVKWHIKRWT